MVGDFYAHADEASRWLRNQALFKAI
jgi:hypothetical protein